jgi:hypothetical protein
MEAKGRNPRICDDSVMHSMMVWFTSALCLKGVNVITPWLLSTLGKMKSLLKGPHSKMRSRNALEKLFNELFPPKWTRAVAFLRAFQPSLRQKSRTFVRSERFLPGSWAFLPLSISHLKEEERAARAALAPALQLHLFEEVGS